MRFGVVLLLLWLFSAPVWAAGPPEVAEPTGAAITVGSAQKLAQAELYGEAIDLLEPVVAAEPDNADALAMLGFSHRKLKEFEAAQTFYVRALDAEPSHKGALEYLGEMYVELGRKGEALALLERLRQACPGGCAELQQLEDAIAAAS